MPLFLSVHNILNIKLTNPPKTVSNFIREILGYFECNNLTETNLEIEFVEKINLPKRYIFLRYDCMYDNGCFYIIEENTILFFPIKDLFAPKIHIKAEKNVSHVRILFAIEKVIMIRAVEMGYPMLHAVCLEENGVINAYSGLQGAGKTVLALQKLQKGAKFLADDKIFVNKNAKVYSYPRGITVHRHLGEQYYKLRFNDGVSKSIKKEIWFFGLLRCVRAIFFVNKTLRRKINRAIKGPGNVRASVKRIFPDTEIVDNGCIQNFYVFFKGNTEPIFFKQNVWDIKRVTNFLLLNNSIERESPYNDPFFAYGDRYSVELREKLIALKHKERRIILGFLKKLSVRNNGREYDEMLS